MFGLDPFSRPVAIAEILLMLALAAFVGWLLGRWMRTSRVRTLRTALADKKTELEKCRSEKETRLAAANTFGPAPTPRVVVDKANEPTLQPVVEAPQLFVPADPLLPAYTHDDTPTLVTDEPILPIDEIPSISSTLEFPPIEETILAKSTPVVAVTPAITAVEDREATVLNRIAVRASELNFDRIGRASATEADDLKDIVGVGPFLERKLHSLALPRLQEDFLETAQDLDGCHVFVGRLWEAEV